MHEITSTPLGCHGHGCQSDMLSGKSASSKENQLQNFCTAFPKCDHESFFFFFKIFLLLLVLSFLLHIAVMLRWWSLFFCQPAHKLTALPLSLCFLPRTQIYLVIWAYSTNCSEIGTLSSVWVQRNQEIDQEYHTSPGRLTHSTWRLRLEITAICTVLAEHLKSSVQWWEWWEKAFLGE